MNKDIEKVILQNTFTDSDFTSIVIGHIDREYFLNEAHQEVFTIFEKFFYTHGSVPSREIMHVELDGLRLPEDKFVRSKEAIDQLFREPDKRPDYKWLIDNTNKWIQNMAVFNAVKEAVKIIDGKDKRTVSSLPEIMQEAVSKGINSKVGTSYFGDVESRVKALMEPDHRAPVLLEFLNKALNGGWKKKSFNVFLAGTGGGKSLTMCSLAADDLRMGKNVLYITAELSEDEIHQRVDANLLDHPLSDLAQKAVSDGGESYIEGVRKLERDFKSNLFVVEFPEHTASINDVRRVLRDLELKQRVKPDIIYLDYINIFTSARTNMKLSGGSYGYVKSICEEFRGLSKELGIPFVTATQTNRDGYGASDIDLNQISESFGIAMSADLVMAILSTEDMRRSGRYMMKVLKTRYGDKSQTQKGMIGVDFNKQRLYNITQEESIGLTEVEDGLVTTLESMIDSGVGMDDIEDIFDIAS